MASLPAFELNQKGRVIYLTYATGKQIAAWVTGKEATLRADIWDKDKSPEGYQRPEDAQKVNSIEEFLSGKKRVHPLMPSSVVINLRTDNPKKDVKFEVHDEKNKYGILHIGEGAGYLWEVDGQHRLKGLAQAVKHIEALEDYRMPVTIVVGLPKPDEALQFVAINTTQKKVKPDLVLRILWRLDRQKAGAAEQFLGRQTWKIKAVDIVDNLNKEQNSPYYGLIAAPGSTLKGKLISEGMFVSTLEPLARFESKLLNSPFVSSWWTAIASTYPEACKPAKAPGYHVLKGVGPYVFHKIAPLVALWCEDREGDYGVRELAKALNKFKKGRFREHFWLRHGGRASEYSSRSGYNAVSRDMVDLFLDLKELAIPKAIRGRSLEAPTANLLTLHFFREFVPKQVNSVVRDRPGVYVLFRFRDNAVYVGMDGKNVRGRLLDHKNEGYNIFNFKPVNEATASEFERACWHMIFESASGWNLANKKHPEKKGGRACPVCRK